MRSYKQLQELVDTTNENLASKGIKEKYKIGVSQSPKRYALLNNRPNEVVSGKLEICETYLKGINDILNKV